MADILELVCLPTLNGICQRILSIATSCFQQRNKYFQSLYCMHFGMSWFQGDIFGYQHSLNAKKNIRNIKHGQSSKRKTLPTFLLSVLANISHTKKQSFLFQ